MTKEDFVKAIKTYVVEYNYDSLLNNLEKKDYQEVTNEAYKKMIKLYQLQDESNKEIIKQFLSLAINNTTSSFLSILDGVSDVGQKGEFELFYVEDGESVQLNEDKGNYMIDYYWDAS